jgi:hypothetical protein
MPKWLLALIPWLLALSGWVKLVYDHVTSRPLIRGRILNVIRGRQDGGENTTFITYAYLTNARKSPVHIIDYQLEVHVGGKWHKAPRLYGTAIAKVFTFTDTDGQPITIPDFKAQLLPLTRTPIEFGGAFPGWIIFSGEPALYGQPVKKYRLTCVDAFGREHYVTTKVSDFPPFGLVVDLAGVEAGGGAFTSPARPALGEDRTALGAGEVLPDQHSREKRPTEEAGDGRIWIGPNHLPIGRNVSIRDPRSLSFVRISYTTDGTPRVEAKLLGADGTPAIVGSWDLERRSIIYRSEKRALLRLASITPSAVRPGVEAGDLTLEVLGFGPGGEKAIEITPDSLKGGIDIIIEPVEQSTSR